MNKNISAVLNPEQFDILKNVVGTIGSSELIASYPIDDTHNGYISKGKCDYASVKANPICLGAYGFRGHNAKALLQRIMSTNREYFRVIDVNGDISKILGDNDWWNFTPDIEPRKHKISRIIGNSTGREVQDGLIKASLNAYMKYAKETLMCTSPQAMAYMSVVIWFGGYQLARELMNYTVGFKNLRNIHHAYVSNFNDVFSAYSESNPILSITSMKYAYDIIKEWIDGDNDILPMIKWNENECIGSMDKPMIRLIDLPIRDMFYQYGVSEYYNDELLKKMKEFVGKLPSQRIRNAYIHYRYYNDTRNDWFRYVYLNKSERRELLDYAYKLIDFEYSKFFDFIQEYNGARYNRQYMLVIAYAVTAKLFKFHKSYLVPDDEYTKCLNTPFEERVVAVLRAISTFDESVYQPDFAGMERKKLEAAVEPIRDIMQFKYGVKFGDANFGEEYDKRVASGELKPYEIYLNPPKIQKFDVIMTPKKEEMVVEAKPQKKPRHHTTIVELEPLCYYDNAPVIKYIKTIQDLHQEWVDRKSAEGDEIPDFDTYWNNLYGEAPKAIFNYVKDNDYLIEINKWPKPMLSKTVIDYGYVYGVANNIKITQPVYRDYKTKTMYKSLTELPDLTKIGICNLFLDESNEAWIYFYYGGMYGFIKAVHILTSEGLKYRPNGNSIIARYDSNYKLSYKSKCNAKIIEPAGFYTFPNVRSTAVRNKPTFKVGDVVHVYAFILVGDVVWYYVEIDDIDSNKAKNKGFIIGEAVKFQYE